VEALVLYAVSLRIAYAYDAPAVGGRNLLRLLPRELAGVQRVRDARLEITPAPTERRTMIDFFGNPAVHLALRTPHDEIAFTLAAQVERLAEPPSLDFSPPLPRLAEEIAGHRGLDADSPHHFRGPSHRVRATPEMTAYARDATTGASTTFEAALALGEALHRDLAFDPEATTVDTPPEQAFARRHGVCQDFAQVMIACLRGLGIPAGYVSGFLRTRPPPGQPRLEGADAMHAWTRVWCGVEAGWIEIDPTNALLIGADHIVVARGRDYADVAPVAGVLRTAGGQTTEQAVDVIPLGLAG
jgi:transglutaminase-like putative cysteine protease